MNEGVGGEFPSFNPHPLPALLLAPFFAQSLTSVPRSLSGNSTETLAMQATQNNEMVAMLVSQTNPVGVEPFSCVTTFLLAYDGKKAMSRSFSRGKDPFILKTIMASYGWK